jgi:hypothetical protein
MCRTLLLPLVVFAAFGLPFVRGHFAERDGRVAAVVTAQEQHGVLAVSDEAVPFTLYKATARSSGPHSLLILAADAHAAVPKPWRLFAEASAAAGVTAIYLEPSEAPAEAATRMKHLLGRQGASLGLDGDSVWTWVEGQGLQSPDDAPCHANRLSAAVAWLRHDVLSPGALVRRTIDWTLRAGCSANGLL